MRYILNCNVCKTEQVWYSELSAIMCPKCHSENVRVKVDAIT